MVARFVCFFPDCNDEMGGGFMNGLCLLWIYVQVVGAVTHTHTETRGGWPGARPQ